MTPPALLFDLDGTIVDTIELIVLAAEYVFEGRERRPTREAWVARIGTPLDGMLRVWAADDADVEVLRARYREYQWAHHDRLTRAYDGVVETIRALHAAGHPLAIVTSKIEASARRSLAYVGIEDCFDLIVGMDHTERHKPDPEPVRYAMERLGVLPEATWFVGDSPHDMHAGNAAGVTTVAATWGPFTREQLEPSAPRHWLGTIRELPALLTV